MNWLMQLFCAHEWVVVRRADMLRGRPQIDACLNCGKLRIA